MYPTQVLRRQCTSDKNDGVGHERRELSSFPQESRLQWAAPHLTAPHLTTLLAYRLCTAGGIRTSRQHRGCSCSHLTSVISELIISHCLHHLASCIPSIPRSLVAAASCRKLVGMIANHLRTSFMCCYLYATSSISVRPLESWSFKVPWVTTLLGTSSNTPAPSARVGLLRSRPPVCLNVAPST